MTGSTLNLILISVVVAIVVAVAIVLVFYADAHPAWRRREAPVRHGTAGQAARPPAGRPRSSLDAAPGQTRASPSPAPDAGVPAERAAGTAAGKTRAA
jgi:hypothetical protein